MQNLQEPANSEWMSTKKDPFARHVLVCGLKSQYTPTIALLPSVRHLIHVTVAVWYAMLRRRRGVRCEGTE